MKSTFDPLIGRLRTLERPIIKTENHYISGGGGGGVSVQTGLATPASGTNGDLFYDTDDGILYVYANGTWNAISGGTVAVTARLAQNDDYRIDMADNYRIDQTQ